MSPQTVDAPAERRHGKHICRIDARPVTCGEDDDGRGEELQKSGLDKLLRVRISFGVTRGGERGADEGERSGEQADEEGEGEVERGEGGKEHAEQEEGDALCEEDVNRCEEAVAGNDCCEKAGEEEVEEREDAESESEGLVGE